MQLDTGVAQPGKRVVCKRVRPDGSDHLHPRAELRRRDGLVGALAARKPLEVGPGQRLARARQAVDARNEVEVDRTDDGELDGHPASLVGYGYVNTAMGAA